MFLSARLRLLSATERGTTQGGVIRMIIFLTPLQAFMHLKEPERPAVEAFSAGHECPPGRSQSELSQQKAFLLYTKRKWGQCAEDEKCPQSTLSSV